MKDLTVHTRVVVVVVVVVAPVGRFDVFGVFLGGFGSESFSLLL
jgi:hypothetical protein